MKNKVLSFIQENKLCAIVRGVDSTDIIELGKALIVDGFKMIEITFDQSSEKNSQDRLHSIEILNEEYEGQLMVGAGTVMTVEQVELAKNKGAKFILAPNVNASVIKKAKELGLIAIPGAMTPTEIANAYEYGADIVKLFPAGNLGADYIKSIRGPINHIPLMGVGKVDVHNISSLFLAGCGSFGIGGNLVNPKLVKEGNFARITELAKQYSEELKKAMDNQK